MAGSLDLELGRTSTHRPIPAEFRGLGRVFLAKVKQAHVAHNGLLNGFTSLITTRVDRYPERSIPADLLADIARQWDRNGDAYRIGFANNLKKCKGVISECRLGYQGLIHPTWEEAEPNAVIVFVSLNVTKGSAQIVVKVNHAFSLHSIARFYERSGYRADRDLYLDMVGALGIEPDRFPIGANIPLGNWRGDIHCRTLGEARMNMWCARTWID